VGTHIRFHADQTFADRPNCRDLDEQWAHQIAQVRSTLCAATRHRHGDSHRIAKSAEPARSITGDFSLHIFTRTGLSVVDAMRPIAPTDLDCLEESKVTQKRVERRAFGRL